MAEILSMKVNNQMYASERPLKLPCKGDTNSGAGSEVGEQATVDLILERKDFGLN